MRATVARAGGACACACAPARPATTRPPNSDLVRSPRRVTRIPPAGQQRPRNCTVRQRVRRRALRERSPIGIRRYFVVINRHSTDCRRFSVLSPVTPPASSVPGFPVPRSFRTRPAFDRSAHSGDLASMTIIDHDGLSRHRARQDTSQVSLRSVSTTRQSQ